MHNSSKKVGVVSKESKQIKESGTQVYSQPKIEEVKQTSDKGEQAILPRRNINTTGNSFPRLSKLIY